MKQILTIILTTVLFVLAGCGTSDTDDTAPQNPIEQNNQVLTPPQVPSK